MKNFNSDSSSALSRFAKDKRLRTTKTKDERRETREGFKSERPKRASFNPNFTDDNRPKRGVENRKRKTENGKPFRQEPSFKTRDERRETREGFKSERPKRASFNPNFTDDNRPKRGVENRKRKTENGKPFRQEPSFKTRDERRETREGFKGGRKPFGKSEGYKGKGKPTAERSYPKYNPNKVTGEIRLNRFVAQSGLCSRREADDFIAAGLVSVNGVIVTELGTKVKPTDVVKFNDERLQGEKNVYLVLNKPKGYVTTLEDDHAEKTVMELVQNACKERIYPVGRLDKNSLGLLLFTNDGDITRQLTHPSLRKKKIYEVTLDKALTRADFEQLAEGITLEDGDIYFDEISYIKDDKKSVGVEIHSGRNRIVRRMFEHLGYKVTKLDRVYYAGLTKKNLKRGAWRFLTSDEVARLKAGRYE